MFRITTDSSCDITAPQLEAYGIRTIRENYALGGVPYAPRLETEDDFDAMERDFSRAALTRTAPSAVEYTSFFDLVLSRGLATDIVHVAPSSALSDDFANATKAAKNVQVMFPRSEIYIVDSRSFSAGIQPLIMLALKLRGEGASAAETFVALTETALTKRHVYFLPAGDPNSALGVKGVFASDENGALKPCFRTRGDAMTAMRIAKAVAPDRPTHMYASASGSGFSTVAAIKRRVEALTGSTLSCDANRLNKFSLSMLAPSSAAIAFT